MTFDNSSQLNLLHWNANGITTYTLQRQLENLLTAKDIHIACLNETFLKENHKTYFRNYFVYRNDRLGCRGGGVALLVRKGLNHSLLPITKTTIVENISVDIIINRTHVIVTSAYSPKFSRNFRNDISALTPCSRDFIVLGDLNAKHVSWNCRNNNTSGLVLNDLQQNSNFFVYYPLNHTLYPHQANRHASTVDIALSNVTVPLRLETLDYELPSDHRPIVCSIQCPSILSNDSNAHSNKKTNWKRFKNIIDRSIGSSMTIYTSKESIDHEIENFKNLLISARNNSTISTVVNRSCSLPNHILRLIGQRKKYKRKEQRSNSAQQILFYKQCVSFLSHSINKRINDERNRKWSSLLENLRPGDKKFWSLSRSLRGKRRQNISHLMENNIKVITDPEKAELLAKTFIKSHTLTLNYSDPIDSTVESAVANILIEPPNSEDIVPAVMPEISFILSSLKTSKAPGFDDISNSMLKNLPIKGVKLLTNLFNSCISLNYFPKDFKKAKIIPIRKPNKPIHNACSYRPISLLSNIGKIFEKIIFNRLREFTAMHNTITEKQFGFKKGHNTVHQVGRIKNRITTNKRLKKSTGVVLLDIEKAFDTVWHRGLLYKLLSANIPRYIWKIVADFLTNRSFAVSINTSTSSFKNLPAGLPQGSILSPILYSLYTSDFVPPREVDVAYYADDTALISTSKLTSALLKKMERSFIACSKYFYKWRIKINDQKTQSIIFPWNKSPKRVPSRQLLLNNNSITIQDEVKYLGVILDKKLTFRQHIEKSCEKAVKAFRALWPLLNRRSLLSHKNKNLIYKCVIRPIISFASPIWCKAANTHLKRLQIIQNKCLKMINNKPWHHPTTHLHRETGYELFSSFIRRLNENYFEKLSNTPYEILRECNEIS